MRRAIVWAVYRYDHELRVVCNFDQNVIKIRSLSTFFYSNGRLII